MKKIFMVAMLLACPLVAQDVPEIEITEPQDSALCEECIEKTEQSAQELVSDVTGDKQEEQKSITKDEALAVILSELSDDEHEAVSEFVTNALASFRKVIGEILNENEALQQVTDEWETKALEHDVIAKIKESLKEAGLEDTSLPLPALNLTAMV